MNNKLFSKNIFISILTLSFLYISTNQVNSMTQDEKSLQVQAEQKNTEDWKFEDQEDCFIVTNPEGHSFTYRYQESKYKRVIVALPILNQQKELMCNPTGKWTLIRIGYQLFDAIEKPSSVIKECVLVNPSAGLCVELCDLCHKDQNDNLVIHPATFIPQLSQENKSLDWIISNNDKKPIHFLTDGFKNQLVDSSGGTYFIRKIEDKNSKKVIYSLHVMGPEGKNSINLSFYVETLWRVKIEEIDTVATILNIENQQFLLIFLTIKELGEKIPVWINLKDIKNTVKQSNPFLIADSYSPIAPKIEAKNQHHWNITVNQELSENENSIVDPQKNRFYFRQMQRKIGNEKFESLLSCLYLIDSSGKQSGINLSYYLTRDHEYLINGLISLQNCSISSNGQYLNFYIKDSYWAIKISDLNNPIRGTIYAPLMCMNHVIDRNKKYIYSEFITLNIERCVFNKETSEKIKPILEYGQKTPIYFMLSEISFEDYKKKIQEEEVESITDEQLREKYEEKIKVKGKFFLLACDRLRAKDENTLNVTGSNTLMENIESGLINRAYIERVYDKRNLWLLLPLAKSDSIKECEEICFNHHLLFPEKVEFKQDINCTGDKVLIKDLLFFIEPLIDKIILDLTQEEWNLIKRIFHNDLVNALKKQKEDDKKILLSWKFWNDKTKFIDLIHSFTEKVGLSFDIYSEEFKNILRVRNWSSISNQDCIEPFEKFEEIFTKFPITIDLKTNQYFVDQTPYE